MYELVLQISKNVPIVYYQHSAVNPTA